MNSLIKGIERDYVIIVIIFLLFIVAASLTNFGFSQPSQISSNSNNEDNTNANSVNIQEIPTKKLRVGDIDIAYKTFGKGDPILLINGYSFAMDSWDSTLLETLCFQSYRNRF